MLRSPYFSCYFALPIENIWTSASLYSIWMHLARKSDVLQSPCVVNWETPLPGRSSQHWNTPWWIKQVPAVLVDLSYRSRKADSQIVSPTIRRDLYMKWCKTCSWFSSETVYITASVQAAGNEAKQVRKVVGQHKLKIIMAYSIILSITSCRSRPLT